MVYVATAQYRSPRWIEIQTRYLRESIGVPFQTWSSLELIDTSFAVHFDRVVEQLGPHAGKLNHLAMEISVEAADEDLLMFLDGDAFTIADPMPLIQDALARAPLLAVRRDENVEEPQPHPSFCVTTVGTWSSLCGDWTAGPTWTGAHGSPTSDVGANLLRKLELAQTPWVPVLRSNSHDIDPLYFGIYGGVVYHHGAGFRAGELSPAHRERAPASSATGVRGARPLERLLGGLRWRRWERAERARLARESQRIYAAIERGGEDWLEELR
jgi:hypothetical protein